MKTFSGETEWDPAQWLAWPAEASAQLSAAGSSRTRVHVVFAGGFRQSAAWALGRTGSACATLGNGPGGYRLGADVNEFVAEFRSTLADQGRLEGAGRRLHRRAGALAPRAPGASRRRPRPSRPGSRSPRAGWSRRRFPPASRRS